MNFFHTWRVEQQRRQLRWEDDQTSWVLINAKLESIKSRMAFSYIPDKVDWTVLSAIRRSISSSVIEYNFYYWIQSDFSKKLEERHTACRLAIYLKMLHTIQIICTICSRSLLFFSKIVDVWMNLCMLARFCSQCFCSVFKTYIKSIEPN